MAKGELYIACEELNFTWHSSEVSEVAAMWRKGKSINGIAKSFKRKPVEIVLLLIDLDYSGRIKKRPGGIFGSVTIDFERMGEDETDKS